MSQGEFIAIGQNVEVYWAEDEEFYPGKVMDRRKKRNNNSVKYFIKYDDGDEGWVDEAESEIRVLSEAMNKKKQQKRKLLRQRVEKLVINTRVSVSSSSRCNEMFTVFLIKLSHLTASIINHKKSGLVAIGKALLHGDIR